MKIQNIVASGSFNQELNLKHLSENSEYIFYGHNKYPGAYVRFDGHSITIYRTGKYIMPGMKSLDEIGEVFSKLLDILSSFIDITLVSHPEVRNIVASSDFGSELDLQELCLKMYHANMDAVYDPESFPGLIYKTEEATFNIFQSGKFIILGCTSVDQITDSEGKFLSLIAEL